MPRRTYSTEAKEYLRLNAATSTITELTDGVNNIDTRYNRSQPAVVAMLLRMDLEYLKIRKRRPWSDEDKEFLKENVGKLNPRELSRALNRSHAATYAAIQRFTGRTYAEVTAMCMRGLKPYLGIAEEVGSERGLIQISDWLDPKKVPKDPDEITNQEFLDKYVRILPDACILTKGKGLQSVFRKDWTRMPKSGII